MNGLKKLVIMVLSTFPTEKLISVKTTIISNQNSQRLLFQLMMVDINPMDNLLHALEIQPILYHGKYSQLFLNRHRYILILVLAKLLDMMGLRIKVLVVV